MHTFEAFFSLFLAVILLLAPSSVELLREVDIFALGTRRRLSLMMSSTSFLESEKCKIAMNCIEKFSTCLLIYMGNVFAAGLK